MATNQARIAELERLRAQDEIDDAELEARVAALEDEEPPPDPPPVVQKPWFGAIDGARGDAELERLFNVEMGTTGVRYGTFVRGYSGNSHPSTFGASAVKTAEALGVGAMLNVKLDWAGLVRGDFDANPIRSFWESWPVSVFGEVYINHEPENDGPLPAATSNPAYMTWANQNAPVWNAGVQHYVDVAAPIIRARGLDVKVGGCLMGFSWDSDRWKLWDWWEGLDPANLNEVVFSLDHYGKHRDTDPNPHAADVMLQVTRDFLPVVRAYGIKHLSFGEFNCDRRLYGSETVIGTDASQAAGLTWHAAEMSKIPEVRMVCCFHTPGGPASGQAQLGRLSQKAWAIVCRDGRRFA